MTQARVPAGSSKGGQFASSGGRFVPSVGSEVRIPKSSANPKLLKKGSKYATVQDKANPASVHKSIREPKPYKVPLKDILGENKVAGTVEVGKFNIDAKVLKVGKKYVTVQHIVHKQPGSHTGPVRKPYKVLIDRILESRDKGNTK